MPSILARFFVGMLILSQQDSTGREACISHAGTSVLCEAYDQGGLVAGANSVRVAPQGDQVSPNAELHEALGDSPFWC